MKRFGVLTACRDVWAQGPAVHIYFFHTSGLGGLLFLNHQVFKGVSNFRWFRLQQQPFKEVFRGYEVRIRWHLQVRDRERERERERESRVIRLNVL